MSRMTEQIGRVLGGRYRLLAPIGRGASAQVFVADDVRLQRQVAVKILHDALAEDREFIRRFRIEAQAAAALSHPHVMVVHDWGQDDDDVPWIVTEYLGGGSLRALLDRGHRLSPSQAVVVGLQAARGLDYAHRRGFVHRDIKPANLLFDDDGRLRIADFGLARALAEAAWTEPQGAVVGTARYAAPEQAQGLALTGRADVYSLALVLVEAISGEVPFAADTTPGTLMGRVGRPLVVPEAAEPLSLALVRAGEPDPEDRCDARQLASALGRVAASLPRPAPLPLAGALDLDLVEDRDPTSVAFTPAPATEPPAPEVPEASGENDLDVPAFVAAGGGSGPAPGPGPDDLTILDPLDLTEAGSVAPGQVPAPAGPGAADGREGAWGLGTGERSEVTVVHGDAVAFEAAIVPDGSAADGPPHAADEPADPDEDDGPAWDPRSPTGQPRRRWPRVLFAVLLVAGIGAAAALLIADLTEATPTHAVPRVAGLSEREAVSILRELGWSVEIDRVRRDGTDTGEILGTRPAAGTDMEEGRSITLLVSQGATLVGRPEIARGMPRDEVEKALRAAGLVPKATERYDEEVPAGVVLELTGPRDAELERGTEVAFVVSRGPEPRTIPSGLVGESREAVLDALTGLGLVPEVVEDFSDDVDAGGVVSVEPGEGESVPRDSKVKVVVSKGPDLVVVPDVSAAGDLDEAVALLEEAGLTPGAVRGPANGQPAGTSPSAGQEVRRGSQVDIFLDDPSESWWSGLFDFAT